MSSLDLIALRKQHPGLSDREIAETLAARYDYVLVLRYRSQADGEYDNIAGCRDDGKIEAYDASPFCLDVDILFDGRDRAIRVTQDYLLEGSCKRCGHDTTDASLILGAGNDFYFCPMCGSFFCDGCYPRLPLTGGSSGYGQCSECSVELVRALPGRYGTVR